MPVPVPPNRILPLLALAGALAVAGVTVIYLFRTAGGGARQPGAAPGVPKKPPPVSMAVTVGQDGHARPDRIVPVRVVLDNNDRAVSGRLELRGYGPRPRVTETPVELPRGAHKEYTLFAPLRPDEEHPLAAAGEVLLKTGSGTLARQVLVPEFDGETILAVSCTGDASGLQFLNEGKEARAVHPGPYYRVGHRSPEDMPRLWPAYEPADVVALNGRAWARMDDEQRRAFRTWVEMGGRAVLCGESPLEWRDPEATALAGVVPRDLESLPALSCVSVWGGSPYRTRSGRLLTLSGPLAPGAEVVGEEDGRPLLVTRQALRGTVVWIGFDAFRETVRDWQGFESFWWRALERARKGREGGSIPRLAECDAAIAAATALPRLPAPPLWSLVLFGGFYAFVFGPVNIWMLRRLRRTVKAWLVMPSVAAAMTLVVLLAGQLWGNTRTVLNTVSVLSTAAGSRTGIEESLIGLFSPTNRAFDLASEDPAPRILDVSASSPHAASAGDDLTERLRWPQRQSDGTVTWEAVAFQLFSIRLLEQERPCDLGGTVEATLRPSDGARLSGEIRNGTSFRLSGAYLEYRGRLHWLGEADAGARVSVREDGWRLPQGRDGGEPGAGDAGSTGSGPSDARSGTAGEEGEGRRFREALERLRREAPRILAPDRDPECAWLVAECPDYGGGIQVGGIPYSNRAGLFLARIPVAQRMSSR